MPNIDFSSYSYFPALQSSVGEHMGYRDLAGDIKQVLMPVFELSQRGNAPDLNVSLDAITESTQATPFILDLSHEGAPPPYVATNPRDPAADAIRVERERATQSSYNAALASLLNPADGFASWRGCVARFPNTIPVLQFSDAAGQRRQILRQASLLARDGNSIAIRVNAESGDAIPEVVASIISVIDSPDQLLVIADCGQGRQQIPNRAAFAAETILQIANSLDVSERPLLRAVCMNNSFTSPNHDGLVRYDNLDWRLWGDAAESFPFMFGDYSAMFRRRRSNTFIPPDSRASVVCSVGEAWLYYREPNANDAAGWTRGAQAITNNPEFQNVPDCRGRTQIVRAAGGDLTNIDSARFWYAAKVNIHLTQLASMVGAPPGDWEEEV